MIGQRNRSATPVVLLVVALLVAAVAPAGVAGVGDVDGSQSVAGSGVTDSTTIDAADSAAIDDPRASRTLGRPTATRSAPGSTRRTAPSRWWFGSRTTPSSVRTRPESRRRYRPTN
ncbi:hypothetical protein [Halorubrum sp. CBA1125]|uniref:hypothetical protein n=1 Tax=Halorubrum sp. CBA1125 TaxID=2668072 RepID=UPI0018D26E2E|nr:hypothetical protein [Halorubrum sp. CBA1125]